MAELPKIINEGIYNTVTIDIPLTKEQAEALEAKLENGFWNNVTYKEKDGKYYLETNQSWLVGDNEEKTRVALREIDQANLATKVAEGVPLTDPEKRRFEELSIELGEGKTKENLEKAGIPQKVDDKKAADDLQAYNDQLTEDEKKEKKSKSDIISDMFKDGNFLGAIMAMLFMPENDADNSKTVDKMLQETKGTAMPAVEEAVTKEREEKKAEEDKLTPKAKDDIEMIKYRDDAEQKLEAAKKELETAKSELETAKATFAAIAEPKPADVKALADAEDKEQGAQGNVKKLEDNAAKYKTSGEKDLEAKLKEAEAKIAELEKAAKQSELEARLDARLDYIREEKAAGREPNPGTVTLLTDAVLASDPVAGKAAIEKQDSEIAKESVVEAKTTLSSKEAEWKQTFDAIIEDRKDASAAELKALNKKLDDLKESIPAGEFKGSLIEIINKQDEQRKQLIELLETRKTQKLENEKGIDNNIIGTIQAIEALDLMDGKKAMLAQDKQMQQEQQKAPAAEAKAKPAVEELPAPKAIVETIPTPAPQPTVDALKALDIGKPNGIYANGVDHVPGGNKTLEAAEVMHLTSTNRTEQRKNVLDQMSVLDGEAGLSQKDIELAVQGLAVKGVKATEGAKAALKTVYAPELAAGKGSLER